MSSYSIKEFVIHDNCIVVRAQNYGPYVTVSFAVTTTGYLLFENLKF